MKRTTILGCLAVLGAMYGVTQAFAADDDQLNQYKAQQAQLVTQMNQCQAQMTSMAQMNALNAMNGIMPQQAPCMQFMPQLIAQEAFVETQIYRLTTGDYQTPEQCVVGIKIDNQKCN